MGGTLSRPRKADTFKVTVIVPTLVSVRTARTFFGAAVENCAWLQNEEHNVADAVARQVTPSASVRCSAAHPV